jgi:Plasmid pRiA4b ORF-3-like protein
MRAKQVAKHEFWWQLRIELLDVSPAVWRRLIVPESITLPKLHLVLQAVIGWTNSHLHQFVIGGKSYSEPDPDWSDELGHMDERRVTLSRALGPEARCFDYVYDFGDDWHHVVLVENNRAGHSSRPLQVRCLAGENACPPEDVGGSHGYQEFLAAMADANHEQYREYLTWIGGHFDPGSFDLAAANASVDKIKI